MKKKLSKTKENLGKPPGSLVYTGKKRVGPARIERIMYSKDEFYQEEPKELHRPDFNGVVWLNIDGVHDSSLISKIGDVYDLHPLIREDVVSVHQRPKVDIYDGWLFFVVHMLKYEKGELQSEQVSFVLTKDTLISFQEEKGDVFDHIRNRLKNKSGHVRERGADYLMYALIDSIVDYYFVVLEKLGDDLENLEGPLFTNPTTELLQQVRILKKELLYARKSVWPLREAISFLAKDDDKFITKKTRIFIRDLHDHVIQIIDLVETYRDLASGLMDTYNSSVGNRMNEIMKVLTVISTIFIPITFIAGLYGMNFRFMPELFLPYSYPIVLALMVGIALFMLRFFRKKQWI